MKSQKFAVKAGAGKDGKQLVPFAALSPDQIITAQRARYDEILTTDNAIVCAAGQDTTFEIKVSELGVFHSQSITGSFTTLTTDSGVIVDNGVNTLSMTIKDGANALPLTNGFVSVDLLLSCGRVRSGLATNNLTGAAPSGFLFRPLKFDYYFPKLSSIQFVVRNIGNTAQTLQLAFHGERVRGVAQV